MSACEHEWFTGHIDGCHWYSWYRTCNKCGKNEETTRQRDPNAPDGYSALMFDPGNCADCRRILAGEPEVDNQPGMFGADS